MVQQYGTDYEISINGLSNKEKIIDLKGQTFMAKCSTLKVINHITIQNGKLIISSKYPCMIQRINLIDLQIFLNPECSANLTVSGCKCKNVILIGDNINIEGMDTGGYTFVDSNGKKIESKKRNRKKQKKNIRKDEHTIPPDIYLKIANDLETNDTEKILEQYNVMSNK